MLKSMIACGCLVSVMLFSGPAEAGKIKSKIKGRHRTGLPGQGYDDTLNVPGQDWGVHDKERPEPWIITPPTASTQQQAGTAPSDATVLFDGSNLAQWQSDNGEDARWKIQDGYMEVNGTGSIRTRESFGSCQLHVEFATPTEIKGDSQKRGNSGVMIMGKYEIQVLDSFDNRSYSDGQAGAIYGQYPPLVNASRGPGQWQVFDIVFEAPEFDEQGEVAKPAHITVFHNGVVVHNRAVSLGQVAHKDPPQWKAHAEKLPLTLQDHGNPVRFRNVWIRPLTGYDSDQ
jgi:hypothetical protein